MIAWNRSLPLSDVATGICKASASATSSRAAPEARTPPPATITGRAAASRMFSAARTLASSGSGRNAGTRANCCSTERLHVGLFGVDLAFVAAKLQMHRARTAGHRGTERLPHHVGKSRHVVDRGVELGHRLERRHVVDLLIDFAEFGLRLAAAGHGDHGRMGEPGVAQAGGEIERADHLRHADARLARSARIAVRHIGGGLLAVHMQPLDVGAPLHLRIGRAQHGGDVEHVSDAVALEHVGEALRPGHFAVVAEPHRAFHLEKIILGTAQHDVARCRTGFLRSPCCDHPDQRCTISAAPHPEKLAVKHRDRADRRTGAVSPLQRQTDELEFAQAQQGLKIAQALDMGDIEIETGFVHQRIDFAFRPGPHRNRCQNARCLAAPAIRWRRH